MRRFFIRCAAAAVVLLVAEVRPAQAAVITFDDIVAPGNFNNSLTVDGFDLPGFDGTFGAGVFLGTTNQGTLWVSAFSGDNVMTNFNRVIGQISRSTPFDFVGAFFHQDNRNGPTLVSFAGLDSSSNVLFSTSATVTDTWQFLSFNWNGISQFRWDPQTPSTSNVGIDNFTFNEVNEAAPVPEPASLFLLGIGLAALKGAGTRFQKRC